MFNDDFSQYDVNSARPLAPLYSLRAPKLAGKNRPYDGDGPVLGMEFKKSFSGSSLGVSGRVVLYGLTTLTTFRVMCFLPYFRITRLESEGAVCDRATWTASLYRSR